MSVSSSQRRKLRQDSALRQAHIPSENRDLIFNKRQEEENQTQPSHQITPVNRTPNPDSRPDLRLTRRSLSKNAKSPGTSQNFGSLKPSISLTPHGRAAQRELYLRSGMTPAGGRRKSGRNQQRETPRDNLIALSRLLVTKSNLIIPKSEPSSPKNNFEEDDESDLIRPRLSIGLRLDEEDDSFLLPPESTGLEDENITVKSVELARHAINELPNSRISRGSFGSISVSNNVYTDLNDVGIKDDVENSSYIGNFRRDDMTILSNPENDDLLIDDTGILRFTNIERDRLSQIEQESSIRQRNLITEDNDDFVLKFPSRGSLGMPGTEEKIFAPDFEIEEPLDDKLPKNEMNLSFQDTSRVINVESDSQNSTIQDDGMGISETGLLRKNKNKLSKHGIPYPSLPAGVVKRLALTFAKTAGNRKPKINKETLEALMQATDWFFEQASDDLRAYAMHAGRKTIDDSDVVTLMRR